MFHSGKHCRDWLMGVHIRPHSEERLMAAAAIALATTLLACWLLYRRIAGPTLHFSHLATIAIAADLLVFAILLRCRIVALLRSFFTASAHPVNLAIFRIVVCWRIYREVELASILPFSRMPATLQVAPWGMGALLPHLPINERLAMAAALITLFFSLTGVIGLYSRTSALMCVIFGFYALGIPQFYGKIDHYHHLLWFAALLSVSPCGEFLAVDALFKARKRAEQGMVDPPAPSQRFALPLRFAMLLLGFIYFFPGFWKLWQSGFAWMSSSNLIGQLHLFWTWSYNGAWLPWFRIDHHPVLCTLSAAGTLFFELTFIFMMFSPRLRALAAAEGVLFHQMTYRFMLISFISLQECYVVLFDWGRIFGWVGRKIYGNELFFIYDGNCRMCRRTVASLRVFDVFGRVGYLDGRDEHALRDAGLGWIDRNRVETDVQAVTENRVQAGFAAYRALGHRIPLFWPVLPLLYLRPIACLGEFGYRRIANARHRCDETCSHIAFSEWRPRDLRLLGTSAVGTLLLAGCIVCGVDHIVSGWPSACYPTFSAPPGTQIESLVIFANSHSGQIQPVKITAIYYHRLYGLLVNILATSDPALRRQRMQALWSFAVQSDPKLLQATFVRFYRQTLWTDPSLWKKNPAEAELLMEWNLNTGMRSMQAARSQNRRLTNASELIPEITASPARCCGAKLPHSMSGAIQAR